MAAASSGPEGSERVERLRRLTSVGRALTWARSVEEVVDIAVHGAREMFPNAGVEILLRHGEGFEVAPRPGRVLAFADVQAYLTSALGDEPVAVPLVARGELSGLFAVASGAVPEGEGWLVSALADHVAVALDSAASEAPDGGGELESMSARLKLETERRHVREIALHALGHDVRSPLHGVQMILEMLGGGMLGPINQEQADMIARARAGCRAITKAIEEILQVFGRGDPHSIPASAERVVVQEALARLADEVRERMTKAEMRLEIEGTDGLACRADPRLLHRLLANVVDNAIKYAREGGYVGLRAEREGDVVRVTVTDRGPGVRPEEAQRIFDVNQRTPRSAKLARGQGLGLTLARELARRMGGDLVCEPGDPVGLRFVLSLPAA